jgi:hypothetical protein
MTRREFSGGVLAGAVAAAPAPPAAQVNVPVELKFASLRRRANPFAEVELDVIVSGPGEGGAEKRVPAFWAGGTAWGARIGAAEPGRYAWRTECSDTSDAGLHNRRGALTVAPYRGANVLYRHGAIEVAPDRRHFQHVDGTPFFWLGDTWWMGLVKRLGWPGDFATLTADRVKKGFTVVQIVAGLYPDMPERDPRGANEAGFPYEDSGYTQVNPAYFDAADRRIRYLVEHGLAPCVVGCWGYYLPILGLEKMKRHWRYLVARWGAYPVVWCLAGEGAMPYYLSKDKDGDSRKQKSGWTEMGRYLRSIDPARHMVTIHPSTAARNTVEDPTVLDFDMLQTGHSDRDSMAPTLKLVAASHAATSPVMPVVNGEVCYEGILEASRQEIQRFMFWACMLSGAAGHTYGANGIWQVNAPGHPFGASPHGRSWGDTPWQTAFQLPGSGQLGMAKALLMKYPWWRMEPHPEWIERHGGPEAPLAPYAAGIPGELRILYFPRTGRVNKIRGLEPGVRYKAAWWNPVSGQRTEIGAVEAGGTEWQPPVPVIFQDYVLVMEKG